MEAVQAEFSELVTAVRRANVVLEAVSLAARADLGLGRTDMVTLELLTMARLTPGEIGEQLHIGSGTVTGVVDRLVETGFVTRRTDRGDRRRTVISITALGRRRFRTAFRTRWRWLHNMAAEMPADDIACVVRFLSRMDELMPDGWVSDAGEAARP
jgi:DNA-binding MarR family transcriptional regulator